MGDEAPRRRRWRDFYGMEAEAAEVAVGADFFAVVGGSAGVGAVFDDGHAIADELCRRRTSTGRPA